MIPNFEEVNGLILEIKNGSFNGNIAPLGRFDNRLMEEANAIASGNPAEAIEYLTQGVAVLKDMILRIGEDRIGTSRENALGFFLEFVEVGLVKMNEHFLNLLAQVEKN